MTEQSQKSSEPTAGFYKGRLVKGGPIVGFKIWHGQPLEPWTREVMDRSPRWNAECNGADIDVNRVWPYNTGNPITEGEYEVLKAEAAYARATDGFDPRANPQRATDWLTATVDF